MRAAPWARWATCALAITVCVPAFADRSTRSLSSCTSFDQADHGDDKVAFTIRNACTVPVDCRLSWRVVCSPASNKRRALYPTEVKLAITQGGSDSAEASAAVCGDAAWTIDSVVWRCEPNKD